MAANKERYGWLIRTKEINSKNEMKNERAKNRIYNEGKIQIFINQRKNEKKKEKGVDERRKGAYNTFSLAHECQRRASKIS